MALIYAGGQWRNVPDSAAANAQSPTPARVLNNAQGSSPAAVQAMIQNAPSTPQVNPVVDPPKPSDPPAGPPSGPTGPSAADVQRMIDGALARQAAEQKTQRDKEAVAFLGDVLEQYGMGELKNSINDLVQQWGNSSSVIMNNLRQTDSYKTRFKGLLALQQKGITDVQNEAQYINLESNYRQVFRDAGLQSYIGDAGSQSEQDNIAKLVGDYSLSVNEVKDRVQDAQRVVQQDTPAEVRDSLQKYYNISPSDLVGYMLDPTKGKDQINRLANTAIAGGYATRAGLDLTSTAAGQVAGLSGTSDINTGGLSTQFTNAAVVRDATKRLANIESSDITDSEIVQSQMDLDAEAKKKVAGLQSRERARFGGTSGMSSSGLSRSAGV